MDISFNKDILDAVCLAFIHSLWQGMLLALVVYLAFRLMRISSLWRYNLAFTGLVIFVFLFITTLIRQLNTINNDDFFIATEEAAGFFATFLEWCISNAGMLITCWLILFSAKLIGLVRSFYTINKLATKNLVEIPNEWLNKWKKLVERMQIPVKPRLYFSEKIVQPVLIGWIKPVVLVPLSFFSSLTTEEAEIILLHELSHVKRRDYLVNLLQLVLETIFFFNPFITWLSAQMRKEREFICDQHACSTDDDRKNLVKALIHFQDSSNKDFAIGFSSKKYPLTERVLRLLGSASETKLKNPRLILLSASFILLLMLFAFLPFLTSGQKNKYPIPASVSKEWIEGYKAGLKYKIESEKSGFENPAREKELDHTIEKSYTEKKRIEMELQKLKKPND